MPDIKKIKTNGNKILSWKSKKDLDDLPHIGKFLHGYERKVVIEFFSIECLGNLYEWWAEKIKINRRLHYYNNKIAAAIEILMMMKTCFAELFKLRKYKASLLRKRKSN